MALKVAQQLIQSHPHDGYMRQTGGDIALKVDQVLLQDVLGTLVMLELEAMGVERVKVGLAAQYVDHNLIPSANSVCHPTQEGSMSLRPEPVGETPAETARVAWAAFPKGTVVTRLRDAFDALYEDEDFRSLY